MENAGRYQQLVAGYATEFGVKILAVLLFWFVGRWLIGLVGRMLESVLSRQKIDPTLVRYIGNFVAVTLNIILVVAILGYCGIQTTTFAALIAGIGIAIGAAWGGLLSNLAAGIFLVVLHPFKVSDFVTAGGVTGTVKEIGLFVTTINTPDNIMTMVGNAKVFADTIQNYSANAFRRVELKCQLAGGADHVAAMQLLRERLATIPNVLQSPSVEVEILEFNLVGPVLAVRPYQAVEKTRRPLATAFSGVCGTAVVMIFVLLQSVMLRNPALRDGPGGHSGGTKTQVGHSYQVVGHGM